MHTTTTSTPAAPCPSKRALLGALWYFEIFQYPLTAEELRQYTNCPGVSDEEIAENLQELLKAGEVFTFDSFFQTQNEPAWVTRRRDYNQRADKYLVIARRMGRLIGSFPFIRAVFVSGSLSKHSMAPDGDIDYFLITYPGRLWLARTLLVVFKKLFLFNSHKYFCVNYFVDTEHLEIEDKNLFTATETLTLLPIYGRTWFDQFSAANIWTRDYLPNHAWRASDTVPLHRRRFAKKALEWLFGGHLGDWLDRQAMRLTVRYWKRKFRHLDERTFDNALRSRRHVSKHHPLYFQKKVMSAYLERVDQEPVTGT